MRFAGLTVATLALGIVPMLPSPQMGSPEARLVLSEVLPNSGQGARDAEFEWFELHNPTGSPVVLHGWSIADNTAVDVLPDAVVPAGGYLVVAASPGTMAAEGPVIAIVDGRIGNGLANAGDRLVLRDERGEPVDMVSWGSDRTVADLAAPPAMQSLAREGGVGRFRVGAPTPGGPPLTATSGSTPPALRITEILADAGGGSGDAALEWVEIENPTADTVDLAGWLIGDNAGSDLLPAVTIAAGGYVIIAGGPDAVQALDEETPVVVLDDGRVGNGLANSGDVVTLSAPGGVFVDRVDFTGAPLPRPEAMRSLALVDGAWILSTMPTPGGPGGTSVLAGLSPPPAARGEDAPDASIRPDMGTGGVPAAALVALVLSPLLAYAARALWLRRRT